jgi:hypothetical protein
MAIRACSKKQINKNALQKRSFCRGFGYAPFLGRRFEQSEKRQSEIEALGTPSFWEDVLNKVKNGNPK